MDATFEQMLIEAERIRASRKTRDFILRPYQRHFHSMSEYVHKQGFIPRRIEDWSANDEYLALCTELAIYFLEEDLAEEIGSVLDLSTEEKVSLIERVRSKLEQGMRFHVCVVRGDSDTE